MNLYAREQVQNETSKVNIKSAREHTPKSALIVCLGKGEKLVKGTINQTIHWKSH